MRDIVKSPRIVLIFGVLLYLFCLWRACPQLEDKGYFLAVLVLGSFAIVAHRQAVTQQFERLCGLMLLLAAGLLLVGVLNMPLALAYKGLSVLAWFACMYGSSGLRASSLQQTS